MHEYRAIDNENSQSLANEIERLEEKGWELVTITSFAGVFREEEGHALFTAFLRRRKS